MGALTQLLAGQNRGVLAIDIDKSLEACGGFSPFSNVKLHFADILEVDLEMTVRQFGLSKIPEYVVCANIPYNITTR